MNIGFNTEVRVGEYACHVQTEVHGPARPVVETTVYLKGRVYYRRSQKYDEFTASSDYAEAALRQRVEDQHRAVIGDLRSGAIKIDPDTKELAGGREKGGIEVQLLNPASWVVGGTAMLEIEVLTRANRRPLPGAQIEVTLEGTQGPIRFTGRSDEGGRAHLSFPMPRLGPGGAELIIHATAEAGKDEIRYALRPKPRATTS